MVKVASRSDAPLGVVNAHPQIQICPIDYTYAHRHDRARSGLGAGGHVGGAEVVGLAVEVSAGSVVAHGDAGVGVAGPPHAQPGRRSARSGRHRRDRHVLLAVPRWATRLADHRHHPQPATAHDGPGASSARNAALLHLATELPAAVLARTLGQHISSRVAAHRRWRLDRLRSERRPPLRLARRTATTMSCAELNVIHAGYHDSAKQVPWTRP